MRQVSRNGQMLKTDRPFVFITQESNHDYRQAEEFGELKFLSLSGRDDFNNVRNGEHNRRLMAHLRAELREFDESKDYVVLTGSPYVNAAVSLILGHKRVRQIQYLRWDNRDFVYIPLNLELEPITTETMSHG